MHTTSQITPSTDWMLSSEWPATQSSIYESFLHELSFETLEQASYPSSSYTSQGATLVLPFITVNCYLRKMSANFKPCRCTALHYIVTVNPSVSWATPQRCWSLLGKSSQCPNDRDASTFGIRGAWPPLTRKGTASWLSASRDRWEIICRTELTPELQQIRQERKGERDWVSEQCDVMWWRVTELWPRQSHVLSFPLFSSALLLLFLPLPMPYLSISEWS